MGHIQTSAPHSLLDEAMLLHGLLSSVEASVRFGVTNDYITSLCRRKCIHGIFLGRLWFVDSASLQAYLEKTHTDKEQRRKALSQKLREAYSASRLPKTI